VNIKTLGWDYENCVECGDRFISTRFNDGNHNCTAIDNWLRKGVVNKKEIIYEALFAPILLVGVAITILFVFAISIPIWIVYFIWRTVERVKGWRILVL